MCYILKESLDQVLNFCLTSLFKFGRYKVHFGQKPQTKITGAQFSRRPSYYFHFFHQFFGKTGLRILVCKGHRSIFHVLFEGGGSSCMLFIGKQPLEDKQSGWNTKSDCHELFKTFKFQFTFDLHLEIKSIGNI